MAGYDVCREGLSLLLSNQFEQLDAKLVDAIDTISAEEGRARVAAMRALNVLISGITTFEREKLNESLASMWSAERIARECFPTLDGKLAQAEAHLLGSLVQILQESYVKAAWNLRKSKRMYDDVGAQLAEYSGDDKEDLMSCCLFGIGAFNLFVSCLPPSVMLVAGWLGFPADRGAGLAMLAQSHASNKLMAPLSALVLLVFYVNIAPHVGCQTQAYLEASEQIIEWALNSYPDGFFFLYFAGRLRRCKAQMDQALEMLRRSEPMAHDIPAFRQLVFYERGWCHFIKLEFEEAAESLQKILEEHDKIEKGKANIRAFYSYHIALCYACLGRTEESQTFMQKVPGYFEGRLRPLDLYCERKAKQFTSGNGGDPILDSFELLLVWNAFPSMPDHVKTQALEMLEKAKTEQSYGEWNLSDHLRHHSYKGYILWTHGHREEAEVEYKAVFSCQEALDDRGKQDGIVPMAFYTYSLLQLKSGDAAAARDAYQAATKYTGYSLHRLMSFRLHSLQQTINRRLELQQSQDGAYGQKEEDDEQLTT